MRICEIYQSIQGEGRLTGTPSVFVRTSGCNLRCTFCDTPWSSWEPEGNVMSVEEIVAASRHLTCSHVVLTGGEPMLPADIVPLSRMLRAAGMHITVETAGTVDRPVACDLMSISPKLSNSTPAAARAGAWRERHDQLRHRPQVVRRLLRDYHCQLKFVVDAPADLPEIAGWLNEFPEIVPDQVWLMPQGTEPHELAAREAWIGPWSAERGYNLCPRMHIAWFGNRRGT